MSSEGPLLDAAAAIGRHIVANAVWHHGRCSWVGAAAGPPRSTALEYRALEHDLYGGTAGVGLFLAHLADATGDGSFRRTALGALIHATARARHSSASGRDGFHAGSVGVAWAAVRAARLLENEQLHALAIALSAQRGMPSGPDRCPDLVIGMAGSVFGLLALADELDQRRLAEQARATGEILLTRATVNTYGWSWAIPGSRHHAPLCGASHGAAGIGWALLELFAATGDDRFRDGAMGAFAYERSWLDRSAGTWPDLRIAGQHRGSLAPINSGISGTWCHGEAGIALTRVRAATVLGPGPHCGDAEIALATTRRHLVDSLPYAIDDLSLCHGLAGAADVLLSCGALLDDWDQTEDGLTQLRHVLLERYVEAGQPWPCGTVGETTPGLFLGLSGIGWLLLRLHDPATPSPLAPENMLDTRAGST